MMEQWKNPEISPYGKHAILISWPAIIDEKLLYFVLEIKNNIAKYKVKEILYVNNTYNSLIIHYASTIKDFYDEKLTLNALISKVYEPKTTTRRCVFLPVCYDAEFGVDLKVVAREKKLTETEIITRHTAPVYTIYFMGFLPGFLYLGGLDETLKISRKKSPRLSVPRGAVGLAENQTGIYPKNSPGGWQIIGNCPVPIFTPFERPPVQLLAGDKLKFFPVSKSKFHTITEEVGQEKYEFKFKNITL